MTQSVTRPEHISVCVCTYRRNQLLVRLIRNLAVQRTEGLFSYSLVVLDNDQQGGAREIVNRLAAELRMELAYSIEPERTIPAARNHALRLARGNYIGIIDDDEFPPPDWLLRMYDGIRTFSVDGALGPVHPFFDQTPPPWLVKSGLCELPFWRTGTILHWSQTRTGNVLLKKDVFDQHGLAFDRRFRTGGSDQEFFRQAMARGCRFVAVQEASVYEVVPPARWTRWYWIRRAMVNGFNAERYAATGMAWTCRVLLTLKSIVAVFAYSLSSPICACLGQHRMVTCLEKGAYHVSRLAASFGVELWKRRDF